VCWGRFGKKYPKIAVARYISGTLVPKLASPPTMAHFNDLDPCGYFSMLSVDRLLAVGWLEKGFDYRTGNLDESVHSKLKTLLIEPWQPVRFMGPHTCDLCLNDGFRSAKNVFVPGQGVTYAAPQGILHYIEVHDYCPPGEFCDAVLSCPQMGSNQYLDCLRSCGWGNVLDDLAVHAERERTRPLRLAALQRDGDLLISRIEQYRGNNGPLPRTLSDLGEVPQEGGKWHYEVLGETTVEFFQRVGKALGLCGLPRQTYRLTFIPIEQGDAEVSWSSEGHRKWIWREGNTSIWRWTSEL
jgi:hypothetical protein